MAEQDKLQALWDKVRETLRSGDTINRPLWEAADAAVPLTVENGTLILGFDPKDMRHSSYLETSVNKTRIQEILQAKTGKRLDLRCIEGDSLEAWENTKAREAQREERLAEDFADREAYSAAANTWDALVNDLQHLFANTRNRSQPKVQARMLVQALPKVYRADKKARQQDPEADRMNDQALNRVFNRLSTVCGIPEAQVALEYMRFQSSRKGQD